MPRKTSNQWDFGELFPPEQTRRVLTVGQLTTQVRSLLEKHIGQVWVSGEVTNLRVQASGHSYFTLKDANAQLSCVLFRGEARAERSLLADGRNVLLQGSLTVYEPRGQYQLVVTAVEAQGVGALQLAFERLKQRLQGEGLFAAERKRSLPRFPRRLGVVTSLTGAALRDVVHVVARRDPGLELVLAPCRVQGAGAAEEIADAIRRLNEHHLERVGRVGATPHVPAGTTPPAGLDLILVTRGGGSLEDLWAFNEEAVARAIHASALPVVSAVGHEIDFTIADFVADVRAATPSAAAEIITAGVVASREFVSGAPARLADLAGRRLDGWRDALAGLNARLERAHPRRRVQERWQRLDDLAAGLARIGRLRLANQRARCGTALAGLGRIRPAVVVASRREVVDGLRRRLLEQVRRRWENATLRLGNRCDRLRLLSPEQTLARGYSITFDAETGRVLRSPSQTRPGRRLKTRLHGGEVRSVVEGQD